MLVAPTFGLRRLAASIERRTPSISSRRIVSSIRALPNVVDPIVKGDGLSLYGVALFGGCDVFLATDDGENVSVPVRYVGGGLTHGTDHRTLPSAVVSSAVTLVS
jgi:hypothetical protein